jgi:hypothetical protein
MLPVAQLLIAAGNTPLKRTLLVGNCVPKFVPVMVTEAPTVPDVGLSEVMLGVDNAALTVATVEPQIVPIQAVIVAVPVAIANTPPRLLASLVTVATAVLDELQTAARSIFVLLSLKVPVAVNF